MDDHEPEQFLWSFPVSLLATSFAPAPDGRINLDGGIRFAAPITANGTQVLLVFSDSDLANDFRDRSVNRDSLTVVKLTAEMFLRLLRVYRERFPFLTVDPNRARNMGRMTPTSNVIEMLVKNLRSEGQQEHPNP